MPGALQWEGFLGGGLFLCGLQPAVPCTSLLPPLKLKMSCSVQLDRKEKWILAFLIEFIFSFQKPCMQPLEIPQRAHELLLRTTTFFPCGVPPFFCWTTQELSRTVFFSKKKSPQGNQYLGRCDAGCHLQPQEPQCTWRQKGGKRL